MKEWISATVLATSANAESFQNVEQDWSTPTTRLLLFLGEGLGLWLDFATNAYLSSSK